MKCDHFVSTFRIHYWIVHDDKYPCTEVPQPRYSVKHALCVNGACVYFVEFVVHVYARMHTHPSAPCSSALYHTHLRGPPLHLCGAVRHHTLTSTGCGYKLHCKMVVERPACLLGVQVQHQSWGPEAGHTRCAAWGLGGLPGWGPSDTGGTRYRRPRHL